MSVGIARKLHVGDRLPDLELLTPAGERRVVPFRDRHSLVLLFVPSQYQPWLEYVQELTSLADELASWDARLVLVVRLDSAAAGAMSERVGSPTLLLREPGDAARDRSGVDPDSAALLIADRYGQLYYVGDAGSGDELTSPRDVTEWAKFLATQCPECGVPDEP